MSPQASLCSCPEPTAHTSKEPSHVHEGCLVYHTGATCAIQGEPMTGNGKEVIDVPPQSLGLRVKKAAIKESSEGGATAEITISGRARNLVKMVGEQVNVSTAGGAKHHGALVSVTVKAGKDGKRECTAKVSGAREMDSLVGLQVEIEEAEPNLPGVGTEPRRKRGKDAAAGAD